ncbi:MAG: hypothetical protein RIQ60_4158 [Pseudomonadota bacterium]|jgi:phosphonate transport system substrate-binding protein
MHAPSVDPDLTRRPDRRRLLGGLALTALGGAALHRQLWAQGAATSLTVGVVPQQSASKLARDWIPMLQEAGRRAGLGLAFRTAPDIPSFEDQLLAGAYDLAYMNPYHYTVFAAWPGYRAFLKEKGRQLVGIIVVRKDSPVQSLEQLAGKVVGFPAPAAFAASILPRAEFSRRGIDIQARFVASHDSAYRGVAQGLFAAGGGVQRTLEALDPAIAGQLRVLSRTAAYTPHALAIHPRVAEPVAQRLRLAFTSLGDDEAGRQVLEPLSFKGLDTAQDSEWDSIRKLKLQQTVGTTRKKASGP